MNSNWFSLVGSKGKLSAEVGGKIIPLIGMSQDAQSAAGQNLPWVEKYRPEGLQDVIAHEDIISTVSRLIDENQLPHLLFYGPPGTGKTSTALACAKKMFGAQYRSMTLELNASDDRGIDVVKDKIKEFASTQKIFSSGIKLIILDEADAMTSAAQAALRRVIEKYTKTTRFFLICNYVSKITMALQSRCTRFRFAPLSEQKISSMIDRVVKAENVDMDDSGRSAVMRLSNGDMRSCLNILQSTVMAYGNVDENTVHMCTGKPLRSDISAIAKFLLNTSYQEAFEKIKEIQTTKGIALSDILHQLHLTFIQVKEIKSKNKSYLLQQLADIEYRLSLGAGEDLQLGALVGVCQIVRNSVAA